MTLERLTLFDFQKHHKITLDLDPHVTVLTGASDQGKSAALRAYRWICLNLPAGAEFIRHGAESAKVILHIDGRKVKRTKGKAGNAYYLDQGVYKAFGTGVPEEIARLLNVSELNFQKQHEPSFWLTLSPGEAAKRLNEIVDLEIIDRVTALAASRLRQAKSRQEMAQERLEESRKRVAALSWCERADQELKNIERVQKDIAVSRARIASLASLLERGREVERRRKRLRGATAAGTKLLARTQDLRVQIQRNEHLTSLVRSARQAEQRFKDLNKRLRVAKHELEKITSRCPLCGALRKNLEKS